MGEMGGKVGEWIFQIGDFLVFFGIFLENNPEFKI
jgi:hypothetical protein